MSETRIIRGRLIERTDDGRFLDHGPANGGMAVQPAPIRQQQAQAEITGQQTRTAKDAAEIPYVAPRAAADINSTNTSAARTAQQIRQQPINPDDAKVIQVMRDQVGDMAGVLSDYRNAATVVDRFRTGPEKAATLNSSVPPDDAGILGTIWPRIMRTVTGTSEQDVNDFQTLRRYQNQNVLQKQVEQKGPQTESDARRMAMTGLAPDKLVNVNARIIGDNTFRGMMAQQKPDFWLKWATRNGSINATENGKTVDQAWNAYMADRTRDYERRLQIGNPAMRPPGTRRQWFDRAPRKGNSNIVSIERIGD